MSDFIDEFLQNEPQIRLDILKKDEHATELQQYFGAGAYSELRRLAAAAGPHLGTAAPKNLIFVPGVMGSLLKSDSKGGIWWIDVRTRNHIDDLRLSPDGSSDADPGNDVQPCSVDPGYEPFFAAVLQRDDFGHKIFPYDWRKSLRLSTGQLRDLVLALHQSNGHHPVHLVAHSMGGLLVRATLARHAQEIWPKLGRIVFIGTPHYGSPAIAGYLKNHLWGFDLMAVLGVYLKRETYRSLRGVLSMLPAPKGIYPGTRIGDAAPFPAPDPADDYVHPCSNFDFYDAEAWKLGLDAQQSGALQDALDDAAAFHRELYEAHASLPQEKRDRMLMIAGVGYQTLFRIAYEKLFFGMWDRAAKITERIPGDVHREGDGRVPLASAQLEYVTKRYVRGVHGGLTNIPEVYADAFHWLNDEPLTLPATPAGALGGHLAPAGVSDAPRLDGTAAVLAGSDDPGLWCATPPDDAALALLESKLNGGEIPEFARLRLL